MRRKLSTSVVALVLLAGAPLVLALAPPTRAGTIIQTNRFDLEPHGGFIPSYTQLPPALAPLNAVTFDSTAVGQSDFYVLDNTSSDTISFTVTAVDDFLVYGWSPGLMRQTFAFTVAGHQFATLYYAINGGKPLNAFTVLTSNLDRFVGSGYLPTDFYFDEQVSADNPAIAIRHANTGPIHPDYQGTVTLTYYYGSSTYVPEPASLVTMAPGLAAVAGLAWRRRRVRR